MQEVVKEKVIFAVNCGRQSRCLNTIRTKQKKKSVIISRAIDIEKSPLECGQKGKRKNLIVEEIKGNLLFLRGEFCYAIKSNRHFGDGLNALLTAIYAIVRNNSSVAFNPITFP